MVCKLLTTRRLAGNGVVSLSFKNADGEALLHRLDLMGICVSTGAACDTVNTQISHVLNAINVEKVYARGTIRVSLSANNTEEEISRISQCIIKNGLLFAIRFICLFRIFFHV